MYLARHFIRALTLASVAALAAAPAGATTLVRMGVEDLVAANATVAVAQVLDAHSYWSSDNTFILTDVRLLAEATLKGHAAEREITITVMGGSVGDLTTLIVGGANLQEGRRYLLFLNSEELPGTPAALTVRDHCQGIFELLETPDGVRAVSQATSHPLLADRRGFTEPPGGAAGIPLETLTRQIRGLAARAR